MISGLVLAAGAGARLGRPKADVRVAGVRLIDSAVSTLLDGGCDDVIAVVRPDTRPVSRATVVVNERCADGMGSSLRLGLSAIGSAACVVMLVDQYGITPEDVAAVIARYRRHGAPMVSARRNGRQSHPVLLDSHVFAELAEFLGGDEGARGFIRSRPERVDYVELADVVADIDTPQDLSRVQSRGSSMLGPTVLQARGRV